MTNIIISGAVGKMGSRVAFLSRQLEDIKLVGAVERIGHNSIGKELGFFIGASDINIKISDNIESLIDKCDVVIEFTSIESTIKHLQIAADKRKSMVIGTTGIGKKELDLIRDLSKKIPIVLSPNMSIGINLLLKVIKDIARVLGDDYDIEITEAHHRLKKDAPSGTALKIAHVISECINRNLDEVAVYGRKGIIGERTKKEIGIQSIRAGDIVGEHTVLFGGIGERIEITHKASSRDTFARGALKAALWIDDQPAGLYDMQDVLGLK